MSRKKEVTIVIVTIALVVGGLLLFLEFGEKTTDSDQPGNQNPIFPFATSTGEYFSGGDGFDGESGDAGDETSDGPRPQLYKISDDPVAGSQFVTVDGSPRVWFIKAGSGNLYSHNPDTRSTTKQTDTTIPKIREAVIAKSGDQAIYRYITNGEVRTYQADIDRDQSGLSLEGSFINREVYTIDYSPDGSQLFYLVSADDGSVGILENVTDGTSERVFSSSVLDWRLSFDQPDAVTIFTPAADDTHGYAYEISINSGQREKIAEGSTLTVLQNETGRHLIKGTQKDEGLEITGQNNAGDVLTDSAGTVADKCFWATDTVFFCGVPQDRFESVTDWYQGEKQFRADDLELFSTENGKRDGLFDESQINKASADIVDIKVDDSFQNAVFIDKKTGDLWGYDL
jgi:hypothetical protein